MSGYGGFACSILKGMQIRGLLSYLFGENQVLWFPIPLSIDVTGASEGNEEICPSFNCVVLSACKVNDRFQIKHREGVASTQPLIATYIHECMYVVVYMYVVKLKIRTYSSGMMPILALPPGETSRRRMSSCFSLSTILQPLETLVLFSRLHASKK